MMNIKGDKNRYAADVMSKALGRPKHKQDSAMDRYIGSKLGEGQGPVAIRGKTEDSRRRDAAEEKAGGDGSDQDSDWDDDDDAAFAALREKRMAAMKKKSSREGEFKALGHGDYTQVAEDQFLPAVTASKYVVCHFFHADFERCKVMDKHLSLLARKYLPTRFISVDAEKTPFFVGKLAVKVLPTLVLFKDGIAVDRVVGFEDLGGDGEDFATAALERRIANKGIIVMLEQLRKGGMTKGDEAGRSRNIRKTDANGRGYDSDSDYDSA